MNKCKFNKRYVLSEVQEIFKQNNLKPLFTEYKTNMCKLLCESHEGYRGFIKLNSLLNGQGIAWFHQSNPYTIHNIIVFIANHQLQCELITDKWEGNMQELLLMCKVCNKVFSQTWGNFKKGKTNSCFSCYIKEASKLKRNQLSDVRSAFIDKGYNPLFDEYETCKSRLAVEDLEGYKGLMSYKQLKSGSGFDRFHPKNPFVYDNIKHYILLNRLAAIYVSGSYENQNSILTFRCECGKTFSTSWVCFYHIGKNRCSICAKSQSSLELLTEGWLIENNLSYTTQFQTDECKNRIPLRFDFCVKINDEFFLIECQGEQHYKPLDYFGGKETFEYRQQNDATKREYCYSNGIRLIEISYMSYKDDSYKNILQEALLL